MAYSRSCCSASGTQGRGRSEAWNPDGITQQAVRRSATTSATTRSIISDLCLDEYTDHGHCGVLTPDGKVDNDATLERYARVAQAQAAAGVDMVGPSGMMDGQVGAIRTPSTRRGDRRRDHGLRREVRQRALRPFREAAEGAPSFGDRTGYQEDPANAAEALREIRTDLDEGADIVMVKPALPYLDVVRAAADPRRAGRRLPRERRVRDGESGRGQRLARRARVVLELLTSIRRAGADLILTYHAADAATWFRD